MKIKTNFDRPPLPVRNLDWSAIDDDTFDADYDYRVGCYTTKCPIGHGTTEEEAVQDLLNQIEEMRDE